MRANCLLGLAARLDGYESNHRSGKQYQKGLEPSKDTFDFPTRCCCFKDAETEKTNLPLLPFMVKIAIGHIALKCPTPEVCFLLRNPHSRASSRNGASSLASVSSLTILRN
jgi:hypothetical protein